MSQLFPVPVVDRSAMRHAMGCWTAGVAVITLRRATANYGHHQVRAGPGALAHLYCTLDRHIDAGDHVIVFGAVQRTCHRNGEPPEFYSSRYGDYTDRGHEPVDRFF